MATQKPIVPPLPFFDTRREANDAFNRVMTQAAAYQRMINVHIVAAASYATDPVRRAQNLTKAIQAAEAMIGKFREAHGIVAGTNPTVHLPPPPPPQGAVPRLIPRTVGS